MSHSPAAIIEKNGILFVSGEVTFSQVMKLKRLGFELMKNPEKTVFDFTHVSRCDSSSLALLFAFVRQAKKQGKDLSFQHLPSSVLGVAKLCGVIDLLPMTNFTHQD